MNEANQGVRILLVHEHPIMREGMRSVLSQSPGFTVVGEAADRADALAQIRVLLPDVIIIDLQMPGAGGVHTIEAIRAGFPWTQVIALTAFKSGGQALRVLKAGARGHVLYNAPTGELLNMIQAIHQGQRPLADAARSAVAVQREFERLTEREIAVLQKVAAGNSNRDVAQKLLISLETVKRHMKHIAAKLNTRDRAHAVAMAIRLGFIEP